MNIFRTSFKDYMEVILNLDENENSDLFKDENYIEWYEDRYKGNEIIFGCEMEGQDAGYISALPITKELYEIIISGALDGTIEIAPRMYDEESDFYLLLSINVNEPFRGIGIGTALTKELLNEISDKKVCSLANEKSKNIFVNNGMLPTFQNKKYVAMFKE